MDKGSLSANIIFGLAFALIVVAIFMGCYRSNISLGIIFIIWTVNAFLHGILFERRRRHKFDKAIVERFMKEIEKEIEEMEKDGQL